MQEDVFQSGEYVQCVRMVLFPFIKSLKQLLPSLFHLRLRQPIV